MASVLCRALCLTIDMSNPVVDSPLSADYRNRHRIPLHPQQPYAFLREMETGPDGRQLKVDTIFLTNRECPFRCVMCDLWKHTLTESTPEGAIPAQIRYAFDRLPKDGEVLKLYNSGNFFDKKAIPPADYEEIVLLSRRYRRLVLENHPKLCDEALLRFRERLHPDVELEIAMGIETVHPDVLARLGKSMTLEDLERAAEICVSNGIHMRGFVLLHAPSLGVEEMQDIEIARKWTLKSITEAKRMGFGALSLIPLRPELLAIHSNEPLSPQLNEIRTSQAPSLEEIEFTFDAAFLSLEPNHSEVLSSSQMRLFLDLWDLQHHPEKDRIESLRQMNETQKRVEYPGSIE